MTPCNPELLDTGGGGVMMRSQQEKPVESENVYEVKKVLDHEKSGKTWNFLIKWAQNGQITVRHESRC